MIQEHVDKFHIYYEENRIWEKTSWFGVPFWKLPFDAMIIQGIITDVKPDWIVETGTGYGGSSLFYASMCELMDHGNVVTVDVELKHDQYLPKCKKSVRDRIQYIGGSSIDENVFSHIKRIIGSNNKVLVILDSWHSYDHVLKELEMYSSLVSLNSYLIVEDTHVSGHPVEWTWGKGPYEAVIDFLKKDDRFVIDNNREIYLMSFNPSGYLLKVKE